MAVLLSVAPLSASSLCSTRKRLIEKRGDFIVVGSVRSSGASFSKPSRASVLGHPIETHDTELTRVSMEFPRSKTYDGFEKHPMVAKSRHNASTISNA